MLIDLDSNQISKNYVTVIYEDKESRVSWYADTSIEDIRFAVLCTCDSLVDCDFEILDEKAKAFDINKMTHFANGSVFFLRKKDNKAPTTILIDGKRKLYVEIDPLQHIESQVAIKYMIIGSNLLKHTKKGFPHIRLFQLSSDFKRILWYTKSKKITEAQVSLETITELSLGQCSENFIRYPLKILEDFSFTLYYTNEKGVSSSLDLTCKDEREFDLWVIGIKALHSYYKGRAMSKNDLLSHSKCYKEQVEKGNIGSCTKFLFYKEKPGNQKTLEKFLISRNLTVYDLARLILKLCNRTKQLRLQVEEENAINEYGAGDTVNGYDMIFSEEAIVDDLDTQKNKMVMLFRECERNLSIFISEFLFYVKKNRIGSNIHEDEGETFTKNIIEIQYHYETSLIKLDDDVDKEKIKSEFFLKELDIGLWKIEVDLENVGDIINRFKIQGKNGFTDSFKNFFKMFK